MSASGPIITGKVKYLAHGDASFLRGAEGWDVDFGLEPWRIGDGPIQPDCLRAVLATPDRHAAAAIAGQFPIGTILSVTLHDTPAAGKAGHTAGIAALHGQVSDAQIEAYVPEVREPLQYAHPQLGTFVEDLRLSDFYTGSASWCGTPIDLILLASLEKLPEAAEHAQHLIAKDSIWQAAFEDRMYSSLYEIWHDNWNEDDEQLDREEWLARTRLETIDVDEAGNFNAFLEDGDLFWGHSIMVSGNIQTGIASANLAG